jgi:hypothetical protein
VTYTAPDYVIYNLRLTVIRTILQINVKLVSLALTRVQSYAPGRCKKYTRIWIDKMVSFNFAPSRITSYLTLRVSCVLNRTRWPLLGGWVKESMENKSSVNFHGCDLSNPGFLVDGSRWPFQPR